MQLRVLGPIEVSADHRVVVLGGSKQRAVLTMLGLEANRTVTADHLIEGLWGEHPPASAAKMVQNYVWRLRTALGQESGAEIVTRGRGYELRIDPESVDLRRFERLVTEASRAAAAGSPPEAAREALALWRGPALADVADEPFAAPEIRRLDELRLEAEELAIEADLALGRHQDVATEIEGLVAAHPLRERLHAQRMLALYRCGRQAEALEAYRDARRTLVEEIGVEPGPELRALHEAILRQDPSLAVEPAAPDLPRELETAASAPLAGRREELAWLRGQWHLTREHEGAVVTVGGAPGLGKTRLVAELARVAHGEGATVLYAAGTAAPEAALAVIARARAPRTRTLLVVDDIDRAGLDMPAAIRALADAPAAMPVLVVATGAEPAALAALGPAAALALEPLGAGAVREIAAAYAPDGDAPVEALLSASGGIPRRVHEAAREWAQRDAARRVDAVAGRAAAGRVTARALEAELAGSVEALQSAHERAALLTAPASQARVICPFKGLAGFDVDDADYFFGREQLVAELVARLVGAPLLAIVGPSGSGKSSVLRAGVLPALAAGVLPGSESWAHTLLRPGERPLRELAQATSARATGRLVLAVDQFEETFTACRDEREREAFIAALVRTARNPDGGAVVVLALRADFYARCAAYPELARLVGANQVLVGPMSRDELRRAITQPARRAGLAVEPELEDALVADVEGRPGGLPLLSTTLLELWRERRGRRLQLASYTRTGGVQGAVARLAEDAFGSLGSGEQAAARMLLLRLAEEDDDGRIVRRRVPLAELGEPRSDDAARALDVLTDRRLVTVSEGTVEVAHEALLREWPRLRGWLEEDAEGRRLHRHLTRATRDWQQGAGDRTDLYRGARLAAALEWRSEHAPELNAAEHDFLDASRAASERARRRVRLALAGAVGLLFVATAAALLALDGRDRAREQAVAAEAQRLGAQALSEQTLDRSLLLARQAVALDDTPATRDNLLAAVRRTPAAIGVMRGDGDALSAVALHPDGRILAVGDNNGTVVVLDARTRRRVAQVHESAPIGEIAELAFSPDGTRLAASGWSHPEGGFVDLFDGGSGRHIQRLAYGGGQTPPFVNVSFSPDSRVVMAQGEGDAVFPARLARWDSRTGRELGPIRQLPGHAASLLGSFGTDAAIVTSSVQDGVIRVLDGAALRTVRRFPVAASATAMHAASGVVAFGSRRGSVRLLDLRTGRLTIARGGHDGAVTAIAFSADGRRLVSAGRDERLIAWDPRRATAVETVEARGRGRVVDVAISSDGGTAYSAGRDGTAIAWDLSGKRRLERSFAADGMALAPRWLSVATRGSHFAVSDARGFIDLFDARTLRLSGRIRAHRGQPVLTAFAPDGRSLAAGTVDGSVGFWDVRTRRPLAPLRPAHGDQASAITFSADGRWLATGGGGNILRLWDARRRVTVNTLSRGVLDLSFSRDGRTLAATLRDRNFSGGIEILSVPDLKVIRTLRVPAGSMGRFSPDGRSLVYGDQQGRLWTFDTRTWKPRARPLEAHGPILTAEHSPDGRLLATTSFDGTARLWDVTSGRAVGAPLPGVGGDVVGAAFLPGGKRLAVAHEGGGYAWDIRPAIWKRHACAVAGRALTRAEWASALPDRAYAPACVPANR